MNQKSAATSVYHIGNSLTWDMQPWGLREMGRACGFSWQTGFHIGCGRPLEVIWRHPRFQCVPPAEPFGAFPEALTKYSWQALTLQTHFSRNAALGGETEAACNLLQLFHTRPENQKARCFLYMAWPRHEGIGAWADPYSANPDTPVRHCREFFQHLRQGILNRFRGHPLSLEIIPVGEVLYELHQRLQRGDAGEPRSIEMLYRDHIHLDRAMGRYLAGLTAFCCLTGFDPDQVHKPAAFYGEERDYDPKLMALATTVIRETIDAQRTAASPTGG